jgi:hypothetical protein
MATWVFRQVLDMYHPLYHGEGFWALTSAKKQERQGLRDRAQLADSAVFTDKM